MTVVLVVIAVLVVLFLLSLDKFVNTLIEAMTRIVKSLKLLAARIEGLAELLWKLGGALAAIYGVVLFLVSTWPRPAAPALTPIPASTPVVAKAKVSQPVRIPIGTSLFLADRTVMAISASDEPMLHQASEDPRVVFVVEGKLTEIEGVFFMAVPRLQSQDVEIGHFRDLLYPM